MLDAKLIRDVCEEFDVQINEVAADVSCDGKITLLDAKMIRDYCAELDVILGPTQ